MHTTTEQPLRTRLPSRRAGPYAHATTCVRVGCRQPAEKAGLCRRHWEADLREMLGALDEAERWR